MLKETLERDLKDAMRAKDPVRLRTVRSLRAALQQKEIEERSGGEATLTAEQEQGVLQKQAKQRRDAIEQYEAAGRDDLAQKERDELALIETYLPKQLSDDEIRSFVHDLITRMGGTPSPQQMGALMGETMRALRGKADGRRVQAIVRDLLNA